MGADINLIKRKKKKYGDSFEPLSKKWGDYLGVDLKPQDVATMLKMLKEVRLDHLVMNGSCTEDTMADREAYKWIANHYDEYESF